MWLFFLGLGIGVLVGAALGILCICLVSANKYDDLEG